MASLQEFLEVLADAYPDEKVRGTEFEPFLRDALVASPSHQFADVWLWDDGPGRVGPERGIDLVETDRGGQSTYHGPGQLVAYPVVNLRDWGGPLRYVRTLEQIIVESLSSFGIAAGLVEGLTGVWVGGQKIAAIGVKISRGVAHHGFSINVNNDLSYFDHIVPCGITDRRVTSMQQIVGDVIDPAAVRYSVAYHFGQGMGFTMVEKPDTSL